MCLFHPSLVVNFVGFWQIVHHHLYDVVLSAGEAASLEGGSTVSSMMEVR